MKGETKMSEFGYNKDGEFEGYIEQANTKKYIQNKIDSLINGDLIALNEEKKTEAIEHLNKLINLLMKQGEVDITRKKLELFHSTADMLMQKAMGTYKRKLGGIAGFLVKIFKSISGK
jgi:ribosomal protein L17